MKKRILTAILAAMIFVMAVPLTAMAEGEASTTAVPQYLTEPNILLRMNILLFWWNIGGQKMETQ